MTNRRLVPGLLLPDEDGTHLNNPHGKSSPYTESTIPGGCCGPGLGVKCPEAPSTSPHEMLTYLTPTLSPPCSASLAELGRANHLASATPLASCLPASYRCLVEPVLDPVATRLTASSQKTSMRPAGVSRETCVCSVKLWAYNCETLRLQLRVQSSSRQIGVGAKFLLIGSYPRE